MYVKLKLSTPFSPKGGLEISELKNYYIKLKCNTDHEFKAA